MEISTKLSLQTFTVLCLAAAAAVEVPADKQTRVARTERHTSRESPVRSRSRSLSSDKADGEDVEETASEHQQEEEEILPKLKG